MHPTSVYRHKRIVHKISHTATNTENINGNKSTTDIDSSVINNLKSEETLQSETDKMTLLPYNCGLCAQRFSHQNSVYKHMRNVHVVSFSAKKDAIVPLKKRPKKPPDNGANASLEAIDERIHPFKCNICMAEFKFRNSVYKHMRQMHKIRYSVLHELTDGAVVIVSPTQTNTATSPANVSDEFFDKLLTAAESEPDVNEKVLSSYSCNLCLQKFDDKTTSYQHIMTAHSIWSAALTERQTANHFCCVLCNNAFPTTGICRTHTYECVLVPHIQHFPNVYRRNSGAHRIGPFTKTESISVQ